ncbi:hypothetical protein MLD52_15345 [Puniceicoccaceae bacterium K14]|nr:hypothetical protein [Puniceicoccaceae bacterium K14]
MKKKDEVEWEVVDSLPSEQKKKRVDKKSQKTPLYRNSALWIGLSLGLVVALAFPPFAVILRRLFSLWWLALIVIVYYTLKKRSRK